MLFIVPGTTVFDKEGNEYLVEQLIGTGGFGQVFKIKAKIDGEIYALKTLSFGFSDGMHLESFLNEGNAATLIAHDNVVRYLYFHDGKQYKELPPYIIMEYTPDGTLEDYTKKNAIADRLIDNSDLKGLFIQLIEGMKVINSRLIHRDIKPSNILLFGDILKIADFGLSKIVEDNTRTMTFKGGGTCMYMSPEAWKLEKNTIQITTVPLKKTGQTNNTVI